MTIAMGYVWNCFWLMAPVLLFNALLRNRLPMAYQPDVFWSDIPAWLKQSENAFRTAVFALPMLMPLRVVHASQTFGLQHYGVGLLLYFCSWSMQVWFTKTRWSVSRWGFMAPSYTPMVWLLGIALLGNAFFPPIPYSPWVYIALSGAFVTFHNLHVWIVYSRIRALRNFSNPLAR